MPIRPPGDVTRVLAELRSGRNEAFTRLFDQVAPRVRAMAGHELRRSGLCGWLSQATQFVDDVLMRVAREARATWLNRDQFFATCRRMLRQEMADARREQRRLKRGAGERHVALRETSASILPDAWAPLVVAEALQRLARRGGDSARSARAIELVYFEGMTQSAAAARLGVGRRMLQSDLSAALAWLRTELGRE